MSVTKQEALTAQEFHLDLCTRTVGPRGGVTIHQNVWRRNGATQTWKTRPNDFRVPIKYGLRNCAYLTHINADRFHTSENCPLNEGAK